MTLINMNPDKFLDHLCTLAKEKELREGAFAFTVKEEDRPGATITLTIQARERPVLPTTEREAPPEAAVIRTFQATSYFLRECHRQLFTDNEGKERQLIISGASFEQDSHWLDILVAVKLKHAHFGGVEADIADLFSHLADLDVDHGLLLTGIFHSHLWRGRGAVQPSDTDRALQNNLEESGYKTVQAVFSEDKYIGFFTNTIPFALNIMGTGVEEIETHEHQTVLRLLPVASPAGRQGTQTPHLSHQTLHTAQSQRGQRFSSPNADPRV